jgi:hypothetical protein
LQVKVDSGDADQERGVRVDEVLPVADSLVTLRMAETHSTLRFQRLVVTVATLVT